MIAKIRTVLGHGALGALASGIMVAFGALSAGAAEYFATAAEVDDATCDCSSEANAGSLTNAMARATADGDVVTLLPGTYDMTKFTPASGVYFNVKKAITIRSQAEDASTVTLKGGGTAVTARCFEFASTAAIVRGITFSHFYTDSTSAAMIKNGSLYGCRFLNNGKQPYNGSCTYDSNCYQCTFAHNWCTNNSKSHYQGGGACRGGSFYQCHFETNWAVNGGGYQTFGGAIMSPVYVSNCVFVANSSTKKGGAIAFPGSSLPATHVNTWIVDSYFTNNVTGEGGGGCYGGSVSNCFFTGVNGHNGSRGGGTYSSYVWNSRFIGNIMTNDTHYVGGAAGAYGRFYNCYFASNVVISAGSHQAYGGALQQPSYVSNCVFFANGVTHHGGAVSSDETSTTAGKPGSMLIVDSYFTNNWSVTDAAAVHGATISNCVISGSLSKTGGSGGGAWNAHSYNTLFIGNVISNDAASAVGGAGQSGGFAVNCVFRDNKELSPNNRNSAGACMNVAMTNCLVVGNVSSGTSYYAGAIVWANSAPCVNCTIVSNKCSNGIAAGTGNFINCIFADNEPADIFKHKNSSATTLDHCLYRSVLSGSTVTTNDCIQVSSIRALKFASDDPDAANAYRLTRRSPARDFGLDVGMTAEDRDLDGLPRVYGKAIDAGCYECNIPAPGLLLFCR